MGNMILVTDWTEVDKNDFYLSDDWITSEGEEGIKEARKLQKAGQLYEAFLVPAVNYAIYKQMDAQKIYIDGERNRILWCESAIISNNHTHREQAEEL